jgi:hypothetical protein
MRCDRNHVAKASGQDPRIEGAENLSRHIECPLIRRPKALYIVTMFNISPVHAEAEGSDRQGHEAEEALLLPYIRRYQMTTEMLRHYLDLDGEDCGYGGNSYVAHLAPGYPYEEEYERRSLVHYKSVFTCPDRKERVLAVSVLLDYLGSEEHRGVIRDWIRNIWIENWPDDTTGYWYMEIGYDGKAVQISQPQS